MTIISKKQMSEEDIKLQYYYRRSYSTGCSRNYKLSKKYRSYGKNNCILCNRRCSRKNEAGREEIARLRIV